MLSTDIDALSRHIKVHPPIVNIGARLTTTRTYPILYRRITKCGSTYLHNILNHLDGVDPRIQQELQGIDYTDDEIMQMDAKFIVLRNPTARFLSLYFDKVLGAPNKIGRMLIEGNKINLDPGTSLDTHRDNCNQMLNVITHTLSRETRARPNWHWRQQLFRMKEISHYGFHTITLEGLNWQLPAVLSKTIPNIANVLKEVPRRNVSKKLVTPGDIITPEMQQRLLNLYPEDFQMFEQVSSYWDDQRGKPA